MKTLAMIVLAAVFGSPGLQEKSSQLEPAKSMADMKKASKPGENHKQLDVLAGIWDVTIKYKLGGVEREGKASLAKLRKVSDDDVVAYLATLPGIGIGLALGTTSAFFLLGAILIFTLPDRSGQALEA